MLGQALTIQTQALKFRYQYLTEPAGQRRLKGDKMKATHYTDIQGTEMNNDMVKGITGRVLIGKHDGAPNFCMRRFDVEPGGYAPRHTHDWEHEIYVLEGKGEALVGDQWHVISPGTVIFVPPNVDHQIKNTSDGHLAFLCLIPSTAPEM
jgi:quercetin dioxygenase-like cupin family protein